MSNYNYELDMTTKNAPATILKNIKPGSRVLEFGSSSGRMTKYLKEELFCSVSIIEIDEKAGDEALKYAANGLVGLLEGNIENYYWTKQYNEKEFDYIIFADVLEHLHDPKSVLSASKKLLKDDGSIWISIPNIAYNGIILSLMQERFNYTDEGILDKTHLRFFSYFSLKQLMKDCELTVENEHNLLNELDYSEFKGNYSAVPQVISDLLKMRKFGEVYQFVWEIKKQDIDLSICIPVFNKYSFTKTAIEDLVKLNDKKVEIIICNNGSTDETKNKLDNLVEISNNIKAIHLEENMGFGYACNKAYSISKGKYILFLNNDIRVKENHSNWIDIITNACNDNNLVGPTGGFIDPKDNFSFKYETDNGDRPANYMSGWCLAAKKEVWDRLVLPGEFGPFDAKTFFVFFEDGDVSFRASGLGIGFSFITIPVVHFKHITAKNLNINKLYNDGKARFLNKWNKKK